MCVYVCLSSVNIFCELSLILFLSSSPLGELFDHGLDSSASWLMTLSIFSITGLGSHSVSAWELYILLITVMVGFYLAHWEKYNTSVMYLPWGYDFSQLVSSLFDIKFRFLNQFGSSVSK